MKDFVKYMLATMAGLITLGFCCFLIFTVMLSSFATLLSSDGSTELKKHSVYVIDMKGELKEQTNDDDFESALSEAMGRDVSATVSLNDILRNIRVAKDNSNIDGIYLRGGSLSGGFASFQEIRDALLDFKQSGKFIIAYADDYGQGNYYVSSVADKMYLNSYGTVAWKGLSSQLMFYHRALEKLGVEMQVLKVGTFKSAVEPFILTEMSEANRLQMNVLLQDMWSVITSGVSESKGISVDKLNEYADMGIAYMDNKLLVEYGFIDSLVYTQDMKTILEDAVGNDDYHLVNNSEMLSVPEKEKTSKQKIAVIYAEGDITDDSGEGIVGKKMVKTINKIAKDDDVKAVVMRVNSPGGSANASEQIWHALQLLKEKKPLVVSMGDYAASGGYYISCGADTILAEENTLTGSIGIFAIVPSFAGLADKLGLDFDGVQTNHFGLLESNITTKGMNEQERELLQQSINRGYDLFVSRCAQGRKMTTEQIKEIAEGRVWSGHRALELGLVDKFGSTDDAIKVAAGMAGLDKYSIVTYPRAKDRLTTFMDVLTGDKDNDVKAIKYIRHIETMAKKPSVQTRLPYFITIQ